MVYEFIKNITKLRIEKIYSNETTKQQKHMFSFFNTFAYADILFPDKHPADSIKS